MELAGHDAIFVHQRHTPHFRHLPTVAEAWTTAYWNMPNREILCAHNADVETVYTLSVDEQLAFFRALFESYIGKFSLRQF